MKTTFQQEQQNLDHLKAQMAGLLSLEPEVQVNASISHAAFDYVRKQLELLNGPYVVVTKTQADAKGLDWAKISAKNSSATAAH